MADTKHDAKHHPEDSDSRSKRAEQEAALKKAVLAPSHPHRRKSASVLRTQTVRQGVLFFFAVALALALGWRLRHALGIVYVSALFAVVLMPVVQQLMRVRIGKYSPSRTVAVVTLVVMVFGGLTGFLILAVPPVLHDLQHFGKDVPSRVPQELAKLHKLPFADRLGLDDLASKAEDAAGSFASYIVGAAPQWLGKIMDLVTAMILCIYFMLEGEFAYFYVLSLFPEESRARLAKTLLAAEKRMSRWLIGQSALMLILGTAATIVFAILKVRYFFLLGLLMGLFNIIPVAGGVVTILLAAAVAALDSWAKMAGVLIFYGLYVQVENAFLTPKIMKSSVNLMGLSVLIALLCGTELAGFVGAMVAVPTAALLAVLMDEYMLHADPEVLAEEAALQATDEPAE